MSLFELEIKTTALDALHRALCQDAPVPEPETFDLEEDDFITIGPGPDMRDILSVQRPTPHQGNPTVARWTMNDHQLRVMLLALLEYFKGEEIDPSEPVEIEVGL